MFSIPVQEGVTAVWHVHGLDYDHGHVNGQVNLSRKLEPAQGKAFPYEHGHVHVPN